MKRRFLVLVGVVLLLLLAAAFLGGVFDSVPSFQGKSARRWAQGLKSQSVPEDEVMEAFKKMGTNSIPMLLQGLPREEPNWRKWQRLAWSKLPGSFQSRFPLAPPPPFYSYQVCAVNVLRGIGPESSGLVIEALRNGRPEVRATCAWALGGLNTNSLVIVPELIRALSDPDANVRMYAANSLGEFGPASSAAVPGLIKASLNDSDSGPNGHKAYVRDATIRALGEIGPQARAAVPALKQLLQDGNSRWVVFSAITLWKIEGDATVPLPVLTQYYESWEDYEKWTVLRTFGEMGTNAVSAVPIICDYLRKSADKPGFPGAEDEIRDESLKALWKIDPVAAEKIASELHLKLSPTDNR